MHTCTFQSDLASKKRFQYVQLPLLLLCTRINICLTRSGHLYLDWAAAVASVKAASNMLSAWSISASETVSAGRKRMLSRAPAPMRSMWRLLAALVTDDAKCATAVRLLPSKAPNSIPTMRPRPRTSMMLGCREAMSTRPFMSCTPRADAFSRMPSSLMTSMVATAAAHTTALAPYVPPMLPGTSLSKRCSLVANPARGYPLAMPLAKMRMSGCMAPSSNCSKPHQVPVRAMPACTSSEMIKMPC
mmetsp:Transcript_14593/g.25461  ORF Transcript_14593/g.25461 Transcript_14593/m.25461 type:complete len:245 (+) Transcript_14593:230-964(+)